MIQRVFITEDLEPQRVVLEMWTSSTQTLTTPRFVAE